MRSASPGGGVLIATATLANYANIHAYKRSMNRSGARMQDHPADSRTRWATGAPKPGWSSRCSLLRHLTTQKQACTETHGKAARDALVAANVAAVIAPKVAKLILPMLHSEPGSSVVDAVGTFCAGPGHALTGHLEGHPVVSKAGP